MLGTGLRLKLHPFKPNPAFAGLRSQRRLASSEKERLQP